MDGRGFEQDRNRFVIPGPHELLHVAQCSQGLHPPCTEYSNKHEYLGTTFAHIQIQKFRHSIILKRFHF